MKLAEQLGSFAGQMLDRDLKAITVAYEGAASQVNTKPLTSVMLTGVLSRQLDTVNMVNAPLICKERDIKVTETKSDVEIDHQTLLRLTLDCGSGKITIAGTLFGGGKPRIVEVQGISMEAELGQNVLYVRNKDKPGFIGNLGRTLGDAGINIATFHLGRLGPNEDAIALMQVDQKLSDKLLDTVRAIPNVVEARSLSFQVN
jgi:D-3-phosphoglycerate dehydrogenase